MPDERVSRPQPRPPSPKPRLDEIFGPDPDADAHSSHGDEEAREEWYRQNRPPHHDER